MPTINFDPSFTRVKTGTQLSDQLDAEVSGSWTLDVWGKTRRAVEQESAAAEASAADLANATLAAQSALALAYVQLRQSDSLADLLADTVKQYKRSVDIAQNQYNAGAAAKSDVITAQALELAAEAQQVNVGVARAQSEHAIAVLTGRPPADLTIAHGKLALDVPRVPIRVPSELLERRPDIAAAERTMQEQNAAIGVAFAGYYPSLTLNGAFGYSGDPFVKAIAGANPVWSYGLSVAQTLFNGGLTDAQVEAARQTYEASVATYRQTVLTAFQQVEDQLAAIPLDSRQLAIQTEAVKAAAAGGRDRAQRISRRHAELHHRRDRRGDGAERRGIGAVDPRRAADGDGQPDRRARRRLVDRRTAADVALLSAGGRLRSVGQRIAPRRLPGRARVGERDHPVVGGAGRLGRHDQRRRSGRIEQVVGEAVERLSHRGERGAIAAEPRRQHQRHRRPRRGGRPRDAAGVEEALDRARRLAGERGERGEQRSLGRRQRLRDRRRRRFDVAHRLGDGVRADQPRREAAAVGRAPRSRR